MGIKFHCPNGHKLNVKSFLAGKKGVCPKCGTKVRIPIESEPGLKDSDMEEETEAGHVEDVKGGDGEPVGVGAATAAGIAAHGEPVKPGPSIPPAPSSATAGQPQTTAAGDPIAEAPSAIWYVRPPGGGQYGPAKGEIMRKWLAEGRVSSDSLVWREGWTDWRPAGGLFLEAVTAGSPAGSSAGAGAAGAPRATRTTAHYQARQRGTSGLAIAGVVGLGIVCVVLVAVLWYVLSNLQ